MWTIEAPVWTQNIGIAMSMGALILAAGDRRFSNPLGTVMIHEGSGFSGTVSNARKPWI